MKFTDKIENLLPIGYLFLVVIGILKESVFYYQIGINILNYSSIMDILISPISTITSHYIILLCIILLLVFCYNLPRFLQKNSHKKWVQKAFEIKNTTSELSIVELKNHFVFISIKFSAMLLLSFFLGFGLSGGKITADKIKEGKLEYNYKLNYKTGESEFINIIGSNSTYYFYISKENKNIKIAPVEAIINIEFINNKMLR